MTDNTPETRQEESSTQMAAVSRDTAASAEDVWRVLSDGWTYSAWVVGTARIRAVEPGFPAPGSALHHSFGAWPAMLHDRTVVCEAEPSRRLVLEARGWPIGQAHIEIQLAPTETGCVISIAEDADAGIAKWLTVEPARRVIIQARNRETLRRLAYLAEKLDVPR